MKQIRIVGNDLGTLRFTVSPLINLGISLRAIKFPQRYASGGAWIVAALATMAPSDVAILRALTNDQAWTPDFITPLPEGSSARIDNELDELRHTPPDVVASDLAEVHPRGLPAELSGPPDVMCQRIADALQRFWIRAFEPRWPRMQAVLEADIYHRGRTAVHDGMAAVLDSIGDRVKYADGSVLIEVDQCCPCYHEVPTATLRLVPCIFAERTLVPADPRAMPFLFYPARGAATVWERPPTRPPAHLSRLLGRARAELLIALDEPDSSTRLAARLGVTPSATNQHLRALRDSGLLVSRRCGRDVLYSRTELAAELIEARTTRTL